MRTFIRLVLAASLGVAAAVLVSCGSSGSGLIPSANAGPLKRDFEEVAQAAASGNGSCAATESALGKTEQDFLALPETVDRGLHAQLQVGIRNLRKQARAMCIQPTATATTSTQTTTTTPTTNTTTTTETGTITPPTSPTTTPTGAQTTPTTTTPPGRSGGTEAGEGEAEEGAGKGKGNDEGVGNPGGASPGGGQ